MIAGLTGSLLSHDVLEELLSARDRHGAAADRSLRAWHARVSREMGPASGARTVFDRLAVPLFHHLGFQVVPVEGGTDTCLHARLDSGVRTAAVLMATGWGRDPSTAWRESVRLGIGNTVRWCLCVTGNVLRVVDATRTYSRRYAQFDLDAAMSDPAAFAVLWGLLHAESFVSSQSTLERAVIASEQFRAEVRASLQEGVLEALQSLLSAFASARRRRPADPITLLDESLVVIYRILFLLFAEARGLVPKWHPVFRDSYTIESLRALLRS